MNNLEIKYENKPCYNIIIRFNFGDLIENIIKISHDKPRKIAIVTDSNVAELYLGEVARIFREKYNEVITFSFPEGEENKTLQNVEKLYEVLIKKNFYRGDLLVALGGGVVGDLTGFTAATFLRGIDFIQIPTTLLSQVDSSIGGKTGVDFSAYKNMVGAFHMPKLVYMNTSLLNSLPDEQFSSGMAEIIKHGMIKNRDYFYWLRDNREKILDKDPETLSYMIYESCKIKGAVVEEDPKEQGIRAHLNYGHTIGHAIEKLSNFKLGHGQCVALGMVAAASISRFLGDLSEEEYKTVVETVRMFGLPTEYSGPDPIEVLNATKSDKKMTASGIKFVLTKSIGEAYVKMGLDDEIILSAIRGIYRESQ